MTPAAIRAWLASLPDPEAKAALALLDAHEAVERAAHLVLVRERLVARETGVSPRWWTTALGEALAALDAPTKEGRG